jgi:hypothetical protein
VRGRGASLVDGKLRSLLDTAVRELPMGLSLLLLLLSSLSSLALLEARLCRTSKG